MKLLRIISLLGAIFLNSCGSSSHIIPNEVKSESQKEVLRFLKNITGEDFRVLSIKPKTSGGWGDIVKDHYKVKCQSIRDERIVMQVYVKALDKMPVEIDSNKEDIALKYMKQRNIVDFSDQLKPVVDKYYPNALYTVRTTNNAGRYYSIEIAHKDKLTEDRVLQHLKNTHKIVTEINQNRIITDPNYFDVNFNIYENDYNEDKIRSATSGSKMQGDYYIGVEHNGNTETRIGIGSSLYHDLNKYVAKNAKLQDDEYLKDSVLYQSNESQDINSNNICEWARFLTAIYKDDKVVRRVYKRVNLFDRSIEEYKP